MGDEQNDAADNGIKIPGVEPTFRHVDDADMSWQQVKAVRNADGTTSSVWEKWLAFSPDPQYLSLYARWDPGMVIRRHGHFSPHVIFVIEGEMWCAGRHCPPNAATSSFPAEKCENPNGSPRHISFCLTQSARMCDYSLDLILAWRSMSSLPRAYLVDTEGRRS